MEASVAPLPPGTRAPDFTLHQTPWLSLTLRSLIGQPIVLAFYPAAFEPVSREQLTLYQEFLPELERLGAHILGVSADHAWCQEAFAEQTGVRFPLLSDTPHGAVSLLYGVYQEEAAATARALFIVDRSGVIRFSQAYPELLNPGVDALLTALEGMSEQGEDCGPD